MSNIKRSKINFSPSDKHKNMPRAVGSIFSALIAPSLRSMPPIMIHLMMEWKNLVGDEWAKQSRPKKIYNRILTISTTGAFAMELQYCIPQFLEKINRSCYLDSYNKIEKVKIVQDYIPTTMKVHKDHHKKEEIQPISLPHLTSNDLRTALEKLGGVIRKKENKRKNK